MRTIGLSEAESRLPELCEEVSRTREEIVIAQDGKPLVRLSPWRESASPPSQSITEAVEEWDREHPDDPDFELPERWDTPRTGLDDYWK